jgi:hypothetical protein
MTDQPGAVIHDHLSLIETADAVALEHLLADPTLTDAIVRRLSPTVAIIDPAKVTAVVARLKKLGHLPKVVAP